MFLDPDYLTPGKRAESDLRFRFRFRLRDLSRVPVSRSTDLARERGGEVMGAVQNPRRGMDV